MPVAQNQAPKSSDKSQRLPQDVGMGFLGAGVGMILGKILVQALGVKNPQLAIALTAATASILSYACLSASSSKGPSGTIMNHVATKSALALAFASVTTYAGYISDKNTKDYEEARAAMPLIDSKTVLGMREYTVADEQCKYKSRGREIKFIHEGKLSRTVCP